MRRWRGWGRWAARGERRGKGRGGEGTEETSTCHGSRISCPAAAVDTIEAMNQPEAPTSFRLNVAEGIIPRSWARAWAARHPEIELEIVHLPAAGGPSEVLDGRVDAAILRGVEATESLHAIPLFEEQPVVVAPRDHYLLAADTVTTTDFAGEVLQQPTDAVTWANLAGEPPLEAPANTKVATEMVAAGVGVLIVPMSLARLHHRKDVGYRPVTDLAPVGVSLVWRASDENPLIEEFIGIVRGRTAQSTRGKPQAEPRKRTAAEKAAARREYLAKQRGTKRARPKRGGRRGR